jgi:hypothetical protein
MPVIDGTFVAEDEIERSMYRSSHVLTLAQSIGPVKLVQSSEACRPGCANTRLGRQAVAGPR